MTAPASITPDNFEAATAATLTPSQAASKIRAERKGIRVVRSDGEVRIRLVEPEELKGLGVKPEPIPLEELVDKHYRVKLIGSKDGDEKVVVLRPLNLKGMAALERLKKLGRLNDLNDADSILALLTILMNQHRSAEKAYTEDEVGRMVDVDELGTIGSIVGELIRPLFAAALEVEAATTAKTE